VNDPDESVEMRWYERANLESASVVKIRSYEAVYHELAEAKAWLFGLGPGQFSSVVAFWRTPPLYLRHFYTELDRSYNPQGSIMYNPRVGVLSLVGEIGFVGFGAFAVLTGVIFLRILRQYRSGAYDACPWARRLAITWCGWMVLFLGLNLLTDYLNFGVIPFVTWAGAGLLWDPPATPKPSEAP
jgi:hypothetical protein